MFIGEKGKLVCGFISCKDPALIHRVGEDPLYAPMLPPPPMTVQFKMPDCTDEELQGLSLCVQVIERYVKRPEERARTLAYLCDRFREIEMEAKP